MRKPGKKKSTKAKKKKAPKASVRRLKVDRNPRRKILAGKRKRKIVVRRTAGKRADRQLPPSDGPAPQPSDRRLPNYYGEDKMVLMARDPWWIYSYWEVTLERNRVVAQQARQAGHRDWKTVLRVHDVTQGHGEKNNPPIDIELGVSADNWYIDVGPPGREWVAELGLRTASGDFFPLVRSNAVRTPSFGISDVVDEEWMLPEEVYYRLIGLSGPGSQSGSMDVRKMLKKYMKQVVSSEFRPKAPPLLK